MRALVLAMLLLTGCATVKDAAQDTDTFAACKTADVVTTVYGVSKGIFVEKNPLVAPLVSQGFLPFALLSFAIWYAIDYVNHPDMTMAANVVTCPIAAHNALLLVR